MAGKPAAKLGDRVVGMDVHIVLMPSPTGPVPTPVTLPFNGVIQGKVSTNVFIEGKPAATVGSVAFNTPPHIPPPPATGFQKPPSNRGTIFSGSRTVFINGKPAARAGDPVMTCNDPVDRPAGRVVSVGRVLIGG